MINTSQAEDNTYTSITLISSQGGTHGVSFFLMNYYCAEINNTRNDNKTKKDSPYLKGLHNKMSHIQCSELEVSKYAEVLLRRVPHVIFWRECQ